MPTYDYACETCEHVFEAFQSMLDKPLKKCPECGKKVRRLISGGAGILFKGSGFYETDYRSQKYKDAAKKEASSKKESSKKDTSGSSGCKQPACSK